MTIFPKLKNYINRFDYLLDLQKYWKNKLVKIEAEVELIKSRLQNVAFQLKEEEVVK